MLMAGLCKARRDILQYKKSKEAVKRCMIGSASHSTLKFGWCVREERDQSLDDAKMAFVSRTHRSLNAISFARCDMLKGFQDYMQVCFRPLLYLETLTRRQPAYPELGNNVLWVTVMRSLRQDE